MTSTKAKPQKNFQTYLFWGPQDATRTQTLKLTRDLSINIEKTSQDITFISAKKSSISIDQVREIKKNIFQKPLTQKFKVVIIENAQKLTLPAQNALLKILEEPPVHAIIILEANSQKALVPTIISRTVTKQATYEKKVQPPGIELQSSQILSQISQIENAPIWLDNQISNTYRQLLDAIAQKKPANEIELHKKVIQNCLQAKKMIEANVNTKFVLFNLVFSLREINI